MDRGRQYWARSNAAWRAADASAEQRHRESDSDDSAILRWEWNHSGFTP
ncbi:MAG: hypothetical protein ACK5SE_10420 [Pseudanabaena sp.]